MIAMFFEGSLFGLEPEPIGQIMGRGLEHVFSRGRTGSFQSIQDLAHQRKSILAIAATKGSKGLRRGALVGSGN